MKRFLAGILCSAMLCTEILSASVFAAETSVFAESENLVSIESLDDTNTLVETENVTEELEAKGESASEDESVILLEEDSEETVVLSEEREEIIKASEDIDGNSATLPIGTITDGSNCFTVSGNVLMFAEDPDNPGYSYTRIPNSSSTVVVPSYVDANKDGVLQDEEFVRVIPRGIFDDDGTGYNGYVKTVKFAQYAQIETIEEGAFKNSSLTEITLPAPAAKTKIEEGKIRLVKENDKVVYCSIKEIKAETFKNSALAKFNVSAAVDIKKIDTEAFAGSKITSFSAPDSLEEIGDSAFLGCNEMASLTLNNVKYIKERAFMNCTKLGATSTSVSFTNNLLSLGNNAFQSCGFKYLDLIAWTRLSKIGKGIFKDCVSLINVTLPYNGGIEFEGDSEGHGGISEEMFSGCKALAKVTFDFDERGAYTWFGDSIGIRAFENCTSLETIVFPDETYIVRNKAFLGCEKLTTITLPSEYIGVDTLASDAFKVKDGQKVITIKGCSSGLEEYCQEYSKLVKFVNISEIHNIKFTSTNAKYVSSATKAKAGEQIELTVTPNSGYVLTPSEIEGEIIYGYNNNKPKTKKRLNLALVSCDNKSQKFVFRMPYLKDATDELNVTINAIQADKNKADEAELTVTVPETITKESSYTTITDEYISKGCFTGKEIKFAKTGQQIPLLIMDKAGRFMGPWRFKFESTDTSVATVNSEGIVTAKTTSGKESYIVATLVSTGQQLKIPVSVDKSVVLDRMRFNFRRYDYRNSRVIFDLPSRVSEDEAVTKYEMHEYTDANGEKYTKKEAVVYQVIAVPRTKVKKGVVSFTAEAWIGSKNDETDDNYVVSSDWSSVDPKIAKVKNATSTDNRNTITIQQDVVGETQIRVKVTNPQYDKDEDGYTYEYGFIIRVEDNIPRLEEKSFTINTYSDEGYKLKLVEGYKTGNGNIPKYLIADNELWIQDAKGTKLDNDFIITPYYVNGDQTNVDHYSIKETEIIRNKIDEGKTKEYKNLYLCGQIRNNRDQVDEGDFQIALGTIYVTKKQLTTEVTLTGKLNLFYDARYEDYDHSYVGKVSLTQTQRDVKVENYYLCTEENHALIQEGVRKITQLQCDDPKGKYYDGLMANFMFGYIGDKTGATEIYRRRTEKLVQNDYGEDIVTGYLYVKYEGFEKCLTFPITIPVKNVAPKYKLDITSATANISQKGRVINVLLVDSTTKKLPVRNILNADGTFKKNEKGVILKEYVDLLSETYVDRNGQVLSKAKFSYDEESTYGVYDTTKTDFITKIPKYVNPNDSSKKEETKEYTSIPITIKDPEKSTAYINVQLYNWQNPVCYKFSLKTSSAVAKAKVTPSKSVLYASCPKTPAEFTVKLNQSYAKLTVEDVKENGIRVTFEQDKDNPNICIGRAVFDKGAVSKGTYQFVTTARVQYSDEDPEELSKPVKFKVQVKEVEPQIKLKSSTFKLNSTYGSGVELAGNKFSFKYLPKGDNEYQIVSDNTISRNTVSGDSISVNYVKGATVECLTKDPKTKAPYTGIADKVEVLVSQSKEGGAFDKLMIGLKPGSYKKFSYKFRISNVKVQDKYGNEVTLKPFTIKISTHTNKIKVTQTRKGTINPIDPNSDVVLTAKISNFGNAKIKSVSFNEVNQNGNKIAPHFQIKAVSQNDLDVDKMQNIQVDENGKILDNQFIITPNGKELEKGKTYYGYIHYTLEGVSGDVRSAKIKITPKQTVPNVGLGFESPESADGSTMSVSLYAGSDRDQVCTVICMPRSNINAEFASIAVASDAPSNVKAAFEPRLFKVVAPKGETARETRSLRMYSSCYKVYTLIDGEMVCLSKPGSSISVNDIDTNNDENPYTGITQVFDSSVIKDESEIDYYREAYYDMQRSELKYYKRYSTNSKYEEREGHYYVKVELLNANKITKEKPTEVQFEVKYKNQMKKTAGTKFKINVTVKK